VTSDSDHHPFFVAGIPVVHFDTDKHDDYHRPTDDPDKLNWNGLKRLTEFSYDILADMANRPELPRFRRDAHTEATPSWMTERDPVSPTMRLGVSWNQDLWRKNVASISQVAPNSPAAKAGIQAGDRIVRLGPWQNKPVEDLKTTIQIVRNPVPIRIERRGKELPIDIDANLAGHPVRLGAGWIEDPALPQCVVITQVTAESPAHRAGLAAGDIVMELDGRPIVSSDELKQQVIDAQGRLQFRIDRQGRTHEITVRLLQD
jgi:S1-C subfamily serine protease